MEDKREDSLGDAKSPWIRCASRPEALGLERDHGVTLTRWPQSKTRMTICSRRRTVRLFDGSFAAWFRQAVGEHPRPALERRLDVSRRALHPPQGSEFPTILAVANFCLFGR